MRTFCTDSQNVVAIRDPAEPSHFKEGETKASEDFFLAVLKLEPSLVAHLDTMSSHLSLLLSQFYSQNFSFEEGVEIIAITLEEVEA